MKKQQTPLTKDSLRRKIVDYKIKRRKTPSESNTYISTDDALDIYNFIKSFQEKPPYPPLKLQNIKKFDYGQTKRAMRLLKTVGAVEHDKKKHHYWIPKFREKNAIYQFEKNKRLEKKIQDFKLLTKRLTEKNAKTEIKLIIAQKYKDLMEYCESDEDWKLWRAFVTKMHENKEKKLWEEQQKARLEEMKEQAQLYANRDKEAERNLIEKLERNFALKMVEENKKGKNSEQ